MDNVEKKSPNSFKILNKKAYISQQALNETLLLRQHSAFSTSPTIINEHNEYSAKITSDKSLDNIAKQISLLASSTFSLPFICEEHCYMVDLYFKSAIYSNTTNRIRIYLTAENKLLDIRSIYAINTNSLNSPLGFRKEIVIVERHSGLEIGNFLQKFLTVNSKNTLNLHSIIIKKQVQISAGEATDWDHRIAFLRDTNIFKQSRIVAMGPFLNTIIQHVELFNFKRNTLLSDFLEEMNFLEGFNIKNLKSKLNIQPSIASNKSNIVEVEYKGKQFSKMAEMMVLLINNLDLQITPQQTRKIIY